MKKGTGYAARGAVSRFMDWMSASGCQVVADEQRRVLTISRNGASQAIAYELLEAKDAPIDDIAKEVLRRLSYQKVSTDVGHNIKAYVEKSYPKHEYSTQYSSYSSPSITKDEMQRMLDEMRKGLVEEILQQVCDEIAKLDR